MCNFVPIYYSKALWMFFLSGATAQRRPGPPHFSGFYITNNETSQSVSLLWMSELSHTETSTWQHATLNTDNIHDSGGIQTRNPSRQLAADPRLRPLGHWDRHSGYFLQKLLNSKFYREASRLISLEISQSPGLYSDKIKRLQMSLIQTSSSECAIDYSHWTDL
jgi:hypothetical protein